MPQTPSERGELKMRVQTIDRGRVRELVEAFNSSENSYYLAEVALHEAFGRGLKAETVPLCIMAVNSFWNANVDKERCALKNLCERTVDNLGKISRQVKKLRDIALPADESGVKRVVSGACQLLPYFLKAPQAKRTNYSFASKFLHWCCPQSMPIVDNYSVKTINRLVGRGTIPVPGNTKMDETQCIESYKLMIEFYNQSLGQLNDGQRQELVKFDFETQPVGFRKWNTPVRILDKWLWMEQYLRERREARSRRRASGSTSSRPSARRSRSSRTSSS